jgi:hypothetical protein
MISFHKRRPNESWRYTLGWRTHRTEGEFGGYVWEVQRWNGQEWEPAGRFASYADARLADERRDR